MKRDYIEFQERNAPVAYMITFRCYGTWLQGDERGSVDRKSFNRFGTPKIEPNVELEDRNSRRLKQNPYRLDPRERSVVEGAIKEVCRVREYNLYGLNVRSSHVHVVIAYSGALERVMDSFKAYATRELRAAGMLETDEKAWSRHGSTKYLWTDDEVASALDYVLYSQD
jgi:REP element-mobilizing transposase RayT